MVVVPQNNGSLIVQTIFYIFNQSLVQDIDNFNLSYSYYHMQLGQEPLLKKCIGIYGCFELGFPWTSEYRPQSKFPHDINEIDPNFFLYTRKNRDKGRLIDLNAFDYVEYSGIEPDKPIYLITHGYIEGGAIDWINQIGQLLLNLQDCNIIVLDWHTGSSPPYTQAAANIRLIGRIAGHFLADISQYSSTGKLEHVHCIGHSLGAHLCGYIGYTLQDKFNLNLGRISGLDPAEPLFSKTNRPVRLDRSAANFVDIIHTDASQFIRGSLGILERIGHVDYFPNGGNNQPGCVKAMVQFIKDEGGSFVRGVRKYLSCNHMRAHELFIDSILPSTCSFLSVSCKSLQDFIDGKCWDCGKYGERCIQFGFNGWKQFHHFYGTGGNTSLKQYLLTASRKPFCQAHYRITVKISDSQQSRDYGGEIGQLFFTMHATSDGKGEKTSPVEFIDGFYKPGGIYVRVVATEEIKHLKAIEIEWRFNSAIFNPLTWRLLTTPKVYLKKVTVESLESRQRIMVCPKNAEPLISGPAKLLIPNYC